MALRDDNDVDEVDVGDGGDLDLNLERQQALFFSSDLLNSGGGGSALTMTEGTTSLDETLSNVGSADHLIHGGHANFLSVNNHANSFLHDNQHFPGDHPDPTHLLHHHGGDGGGGGQPPSRPPSRSCCGRPFHLPASVMAKLNKLSVRSGLYKVVGEFGLRENLYYGSIFLCMTLIVIVCFLVINNRGGAGLSGLVGGTAAAYDGGN